MMEIIFILFLQVTLSPYGFTSVESIWIPLQISTKIVLHLLSLPFLPFSQTPGSPVPLNFLLPYQEPYLPFSLWPGCQSLCSSIILFWGARPMGGDFRAPHRKRWERFQNTFLLLRWISSWRNSGALLRCQCSCVLSKNPSAEQSAVIWDPAVGGKEPCPEREWGSKLTYAVLPSP